MKSAFFAFPAVGRIGPFVTKVAEQGRNPTMIWGIPGGLLRALFSLAGVLLVAACVPSGDASATAAPPLQASSCRAIDGDTIDCGGTHVRLVNIDAPEMHGACASETALARQAQGFTAAALRTARTIEIRLDPRRPRDRYGRTLAWVILDGRDLGESLVAARLARFWDGRRRSWCP